MRDPKIYRALLVALAVLGALAHAWQFRTFYVDDAAISYSYARTWAEGGGLVVQHGAERVEGYSNFLWVVLLAAGIVARADVFVLSHVLGALALVATVIGAAVLLAKLRGRPSPLDALPAFVCAGLTPVPYWAMSGLEGGLYTSLTIWLCIALLHEADDPRRAPLSAVVAAALALCRPDGVLFVGVAVFVRLVTVGRARLLLHLAIATLPVLLHHVARHAYYGYWFPNTFYVKAPAPTHLVDRFLRGSKGWVYIEKVVEQYKLVAPLGLALLAPFASSSARRRLGPILSIGAVGFFTIYAQGDWMSEGRFLVAALPLVAVLAVDAVEQLARRQRRAWFGATVGTAIAGLILAAMVPAMWRSTKSRRNNYPVPVQSVAMRARAVVELKRDLELTDVSFLDGDLGGTSYYAGKGKDGVKMVDLGALADVTIARYQHDLAILREYILYEKRPTVLRLTGFWSRSGLQLMPETREEYTQLLHVRNLLGMLLRRDAVTVTGIDTQKALVALPSAGLDLIGADVGEQKVLLYLLVRTPGRPLPTLSSAERSVKVAPPAGVFPPSEWLPGEIVKILVDRPPGALSLCDDARCLTLDEGKSGAQPLAPLPRPPIDAARTLADGLAARARGDYDEAARLLRAAIEADPTAVAARRALEEIRPLRREMAPLRLIAPLGAARRAFYLAPNPTTLTALLRLALAAGRPEVAALAQRATGLAPAGADGPALLADALAGKSRFVVRSDDKLAHTFEHGMNGWTATGDALRTGPRRALHSSDVLSPRADKLFDTFMHIDGAYWALPMRVLAEASANPAMTLPMVNDPKEFSLSQLTYVLFGPGVWWLRDVVGLEGRHYLDSGLLGDLQIGTLRSLPFVAVDEVCFSIGGGQNGAGVRLYLGDAPPQVVNGQREEVLRRQCLPIGGKPGAVLEIFDESTAPFAHVLFDDLECWKDGVSVPCAG